jgi:hypothetical protein
MTPALSTIACARVKSASAAARSASQISSAQENDNYISDVYVTDAWIRKVFLVTVQGHQKITGTLQQSRSFLLFHLQVYSKAKWPLFEEFNGS